MALQVEVVSNSEAAKKDLDILRVAIENIKKATSGLSFNLFNTNALANTKAGVASIDTLNKSSKTASESVTRLNSNLASGGVNSKVLAAALKDGERSVGVYADRTAIASKNTKEMANNASVATTSYNAAASQASKLGTALVASASAYASMSTLDTITNISSQIRLATNTQQEYNIALSATRQIAISSRSGISEITDLYSRISRSTSTFARSQEDVLKVTEATAKAINLYGANAQTSGAAIMQLGQALGSGVLQGDELRSILENAPALADMLAKGFGKTIGQLRQLGADGKLVSKDVFKAILSQTDQMNVAFSKAGMTFTQAFGNVGSSIIILISSLGDALSGITTGGASGKSLPSYVNDIAIAIANFSENINYLLIRARTVVAIAFADIQEFSRKPISFQLDFIKFKLSDMFPSRSEIQSYFGGLQAALFSMLPDTYNPMKKASGGLISGPGSGTSDSIPAMVSNGEFVVKAGAVSKNLALLNAINSGNVIPQYADGGLVGTGTGMLKSFSENTVVVGLLEKIQTTFQDGFKSFNNYVNTIDGENTKRLTWVEKITLITIDIFTRVDSGIKSGFSSIGELLKNVWAGIGSMVAKAADQASSVSPGMAKFIETFRSITRTGPYTGGGPQRNQPNEDRSIFHDLLSTYVPVKAQIPVLAVSTAAVAAGVLAFTSSGIVRSTLLGLLTTAFGLAVGANVYDSEIMRVEGALTKGAVSMVKSVTDTLFGSGIFGDRGFGGTLALIAKLSLLFAAGREMVGGALLKTATAPTALGGVLALKGQSMYSDFQLKRNETKLEPIANAFEKATAAQVAAVKDLSRYNGVGGRLQASQVTSIANGTSPIPTNTSIELQRLSTAARTSTQALDNLKTNQGVQLKEVQANVAVMKTHTEALRASLKAKGEAFKSGVTTLAGGIGGIFGSLAGFNIGSQIAEGMVGASDWQKIGVQIGSALFGQTILSTAGATFAAVAFSPITWVVAAIAGVFALAFKMWTDWPWFEAAYDKWVLLGERWVASLLRVLPKSSSPTLQDLTAKSIKYAEVDSKAGAAADAKKSALTTEELIAATDRLALATTERTARDLKIEAPKYMSDAMFGMSITGYRSDDAKVAKLIAESERASSSFNGDKTSADYTAIAKLVTEAKAEVAKAQIDAKAQQDFSPLLDVSKAGYEVLSTAIGNLGDTLGKWFLSVTPAGALKRASGGFISGPGSGTSDSIPAMLSNGEFVINAKAAAANADLLHSINNGSAVSRFAGGYTRGAMQNDPRRLDANVGVFERLVSAIRGIESGGNPNALSFQGASGSMQIMEDTFNQYKKAGEVFTNETDRVAASLRKLTDDFNFYSGDVAKVAAAYHGGRGAIMANGEIDPSKHDWKAKGEVGMYTTDYAARILAKVNGTTNAASDTDALFKDLPFGDSLKSGFKKLDVETQEMIRGWIKTIRGYLGTSSFKATQFTKLDPLADAFNKTAKYVGNTDAPALTKDQLASMSNMELTNVRTVVAEVEALMAERSGGKASELRLIEISNLLKESSAKITTIMAPKDKKEPGSPFGDIVSLDTISRALLNLGVSLDSSEITKLTSSDIAAVGNYMANINEATKAMEHANVGLKEYLKLRIAESNQAIKQIGEKVKTPPANTKIEANARAQAAGTLFANNMQTSTYEGLVSALKGTTSFKDFGALLVDKFTSGIIEAGVKGFTDDLFKNVFTNIFAKAGGDVYAGGEKASGSNSKGSISGFLKDQFDTVKGYFANPEEDRQKSLGSFRKSEILAQNAGSGYTDIIGGASEEFTTALNNFGTDIPNAFGSVFADNTASFGDTLTGFNRDFGSSLMNLLSGLGGGGSSDILGGLLGMFDGGGSGTFDPFSLISFAEGGMINGAGTGTSDSILAAVSNGEFVVNAQATKQYGNLLSRINSGGIPKFATGGIVGQDIPQLSSAQSMLTKTASTSKSSTQVFHINITGDVSQQTRREIQQMIPQIASGVNTHNYEQGGNHR